MSEISLNGLALMINYQFMFMKSLIYKSLFLVGVLKDVFPYGVTWRSRNRNKRVILRIISPIAFLIGACIKCYGYLCNLYRNRHTFRYKLCVVVIAKNESAYIEEWVAFQKVIGVDRIFMYDNDSTDGMKNYIQKYIDDGYIIYNTISGKCRQYDAYNDALKRYGPLCKYMAFIDCDEFLIPAKPEDSVIDIIEQTFKKDRNAGGIGVNWAIYGSSGHKTKTQGLVIERFTFRCKTDFIDNRHIKSIVKPTCVKAYKHCHYPIYRLGTYGINLDGDIIGTWYNYVKEFPAIRINHYFTKSKEEWDVRRGMGKCIYPKTESPFRMDDEFYKSDQNDVKDEIALKYVDSVKTTMLTYSCS